MKLICFWTALALLIAPLLAAGATPPTGTIQDEHLDAPANSPLGRYERIVMAAFQAHWLVEANSNGLHLTHTASAKVHLSVRPDGRAVAVRYAGPADYPALKTTVLKAIRNAKLPAMSPEVVAALPAGKRLDANFVFKLY